MGGGGGGAVWVGTHEGALKRFTADRSGGGGGGGGKKRREGERRMWKGLEGSKAPYHVICVCIQVVFSGWHVIASVALKDGANPIVVAAYREASSTLMMYGLCRAYGLGLLGIDLREDGLRFLAAGFFSFCNVMGSVVALDLITPDRFAVLQPTIPVWTMLISVIVGLEPLRWLKVGAIALAVAGAVVVEVGPGDDGGSANTADQTLGTLVTICQCIGMALVVVLTKPLCKKYPPMLVTCAYYTVGSVCTGAVVAGFVPTLTTDDAEFKGNPMAWAAIAYVSVIATFLTYNGWSLAVKHLNASVTAVYCVLQPVCTMVLSIVVWAQLPGVPEITGGVLAIVGLLLTVASEQLSSPAEPEAAAAEDEGRAKDSTSLDVVDDDDEQHLTASLLANDALDSSLEEEV
mmetsp:Transcript_15410/g.46464  ORF Transcript_15410/g.46464 Transcript_15410/m.46464 type:complete len:404 (-) Transcript_15410:1079-2290(-)